MPARTSRPRRIRKTSAVWPWWQLEVVGPSPKLSGRARARLSPHLLNLRADLTAPAPSPRPARAPATSARESVDFAPSGFQWGWLVPKPLPALLAPWPALADLSLITCLDVLWCLGGTACLAVAYAFVRLAVEAKVIGRSIQVDADTYLGVVRQVVVAPFAALAPAAARTPVVLPTRRLAAVCSFAAVAFLLVLPLKGIAMLGQVNEQSHLAAEVAQEALFSLTVGADQLAHGQAGLAQASFAQASGLFDQALATLGGFPQPLVTLFGHVPGPTAELSSAVHLLAASREAASAASSAAAAWQRVSGAPQGSADLATNLAVLRSATAEVEPHLRAALTDLSNVATGDLPPALQPMLAGLVAQLGNIEQLVATATVLPGFLEQVLASPSLRRYVVLFQNSSELRPTGGFLGSLAFIELSGGKVSQLTIPGGGTYDFQGSLGSVVRPPEPMRIVRGTWQLQDANWFFDFPTSAEKVLWFLKQSGAPAVDGVLAITADVAAQLISVTGPIELPAYGKVLTADNFVSETQAAVELEYDPAGNRPKQFIADLAPVLIDRLMHLDGEHQLALLGLLQQGLYQRGLQLYLTDAGLEQQVKNFGWAGEVKSTALDYLAVVRTNIGGGKTDAVTDEELAHEVEVQPSGQLIVHLTFTRHHGGDARGAFTWWRNQDYVRFYVPQGSTLVAADGFTPPPADHFRAVPDGATPDQDLAAVEQNGSLDPVSGTRLTEEFGKTVFGNWLNVMPGQSQTVHLTYSLPFSLEPGTGWQDLRRYAVYFQRQAGVRPLNFTSTITWPAGWRVRWQQGSESLVSEPGRVELRGDLSHDEFYGVVLERLDAPALPEAGAGT